jgi:hypothetical protein
MEKNDTLELALYRDFFDLSDSGIDCRVLSKPLIKDQTKL